MTDTFKEALMLSNKTYFLEEMYKQKNIQRDLQEQLKVKDQIAIQCQREQKLAMA